MLPSPAILEALQKKFPSVWLASGGEEIMVTCPYCHLRGMSRDTSGHLALNFEKGMAHCVKCDWGNRSLRSWLKDQNFEGQLPLPSREALSLKKPERPRFPLLQSAEIPPFAVPMRRGEQGMFADALRKKKLTDDDWIKAKVHQCDRGRYAGYTIFPFYENRVMVYWQGRSADPDIPAWRRKQNPDDLKLGKASWLYGYDPSLPRGGTVYLVEGTLDQISTLNYIEKHKGDGHFCFGINGTAFSFPDDITHPLNTQFGKLMHLKPAEVVVLFDPDAIKKAKGLAYVLETCGIPARVAELSASDGDPNEADEAALTAATTRNVSWAEQATAKLNRLQPT